MDHVACHLCGLPVPCGCSHSESLLYYYELENHESSPMRSILSKSISEPIISYSKLVDTPKGIGKVKISIENDITYNLNKIHSDSENVVYPKRKKYSVDLMSLSVDALEDGQPEDKVDEFSRSFGAPLLPNVKTGLVRWTGGLCLVENSTFLSIDDMEDEEDVFENNEFVVVGETSGKKVEDMEEIVSFAEMPRRHSIGRCENFAANTFTTKHKDNRSMLPNNLLSNTSSTPLRSYPNKQRVYLNCEISPLRSSTENSPVQQIPTANRINKSLRNEAKAEEDIDVIQIEPSNDKDAINSNIDLQMDSHNIDMQTKEGKKCFNKENNLKKTEENISENENLAKERLKLEYSLKLQSSEEQPMNEQLTKQRFSIDQRLKEKSLEEKRLNGERLNEQRLNEQRLNEQRLNEQRLNEQRLNEQRLQEQPLADQPLEDQPLKEQPLEEHSLKGQALKDQSLKQQPLNQKSSEDPVKKAIKVSNLSTYISPYKMNNSLKTSFTEDHSSHSSKTSRLLIPNLPRNYVSPLFLRDASFNGSSVDEQSSELRVRRRLCFETEKQRKCDENKLRQSNYKNIKNNEIVPDGLGSDEKVIVNTLGKIYGDLEEAHKESSETQANKLKNMQNLGTTELKLNKVEIEDSTSEVSNMNDEQPILTGKVRRMSITEFSSQAEKMKPKIVHIKRKTEQPKPSTEQIKLDIEKVIPNTEQITRNTEQFKLNTKQIKPNTEHTKLSTEQIKLNTEQIIPITEQVKQTKQIKPIILKAEPNKQKTESIKPKGADQIKLKTRQLKPKCEQKLFDSRKIKKDTFRTYDKPLSRHTIRNRKSFSSSNLHDMSSNDSFTDYSFKRYKRKKSVSSKDSAFSSSEYFGSKKFGSSFLSRMEQMCKQVSEENIRNLNSVFAGVIEYPEEGCVMNEEDYSPEKLSKEELPKEELPKQNHKLPNENLVKDKKVSDKLITGKVASNKLKEKRTKEKLATEKRANEILTIEKRANEILPIGKSRNEHLIKKAVQKPLIAIDLTKKVITETISNRHVENEEIKPIDLTEGDYVKLDELELEMKDNYKLVEYEEFCKTFKDKQIVHMNNDTFNKNRTNKPENWSFGSQPYAMDIVLRNKKYNRKNEQQTYESERSPNKLDIKPSTSKAALLNYENIQESSRFRRNCQATEKLREGILSNKNSPTSNMSAKVELSPIRTPSSKNIGLNRLNSIRSHIKARSNRNKEVIDVRYNYDLQNDKILSASPNFFARNYCLTPNTACSSPKKPKMNKIVRQELAPVKTNFVCVGDTSSVILDISIIESSTIQQRKAVFTCEPVNGSPQIKKSQVKPAENEERFIVNAYRSSGRKPNVEGTSRKVLENKVKVEQDRNVEENNKFCPENNNTYVKLDCNAYSPVQNVDLLENCEVITPKRPRKTLWRKIKSKVSAMLK